MTDTAIEPLQAPPQQPPDPRPVVDTLRSWPFLALGTVMIGTLVAVTIGPSLWSDEEIVQPKSDPTISGRSRPMMPTDYSELGRPVTPTKPVEETPAAETPVTQETTTNPVVTNGGGGYSGGNQNQGPTKAELLAMARMADIKRVPVVSAGYVGNSQDASVQGAAAGGGGATTRLNGSHRLAQPYSCQIDAGTNIPAMTEYRLTSETKGVATAIAMRDVWSSDKTCLAVPRGSRFVGNYQTEVAEGQVRLGVIWTAVTRPPPRPGMSGDTIDLDNTVAGDPDGTSGISGEVNNHFWKKLGYVTAATVLDLARTTITASGEGGVAAAIGGIFANRASSPVDEWAKKQLDIPPTITVEPREISIVLAQHLPMTEYRKRR